MAEPDKVEVEDIQVLWSKVVLALSEQTLNPGPLSYQKVHDAINLYAGGMYELGLYNGYQDGVQSKHELSD